MREEVIALIDADTMLWVTAYHFKDNQENLFGIKNELDTTVQEILHKVKATKYMGFLGNSSATFRHKLATIKTYKGARKPTPEYVKNLKPVMISHLVDKWGFTIVDGIEADDAVSICQVNMKNTIICGIDKDLLQIPGRHYNINKEEFSVTTTKQGEERLFKQSVTGDSTDSIMGIPKVGPKKADIMFENSTNALITALKGYMAHCDSDVEALYMFVENLRLVRLLTKESKVFKIPEMKSVEDVPKTEDDVDYFGMDE